MPFLDQPQPARRVRFTETDRHLPNPHRGICTFQRFDGDALYPAQSWSEHGPTTFPARAFPGAAPGYLSSTVAYCRWYWRSMEPKQGEYDFSMIEGALATAAERGQTLAVRLMAYGGKSDAPLPDWFLAKQPDDVADRSEADSAFYRERWGRYVKPPDKSSTDHDSALYLEHWGGLVREFARRFDADPRLESIDVAYIGQWGEGAGYCSPQRCREFARLWQEAFTRTPRIALVGGDQLGASIETGSGWRADCFGDMSDEECDCVYRVGWWNHMHEMYPRSVAQSGAADAWKHAPIHLETCWVPTYWFQQGWDLGWILEQGMKYHATYLMPKSCALPPSWIDQIDRFCRRLGYRHVIRHASVQSPILATATAFNFQAWIENVGVAPIYRRYDVALRLRQHAREEIVVLPAVDIRAWLPGDAWIDEQVAVPAGFGPGWVDVAIGIVGRDGRKPAVRFAVKDAECSGWVPTAGLEIR